MIRLAMSPGKDAVRIVGTTLFSAAVDRLRRVSRRHSLPENHRLWSYMYSIQSKG